VECLLAPLALKVGLDVYLRHWTWYDPHDPVTADATDTDRPNTIVATIIGGLAADAIIGGAMSRTRNAARSSRQTVPSAMARVLSSW
jgi:hypothetical protein